jgi:AcrR family transcriptional regulator
VTGRPPATASKPPPADGSRRTEILDTAAALFAASGPRASLKEIADACGILPGSLYHHFESKDAIVLELVERYQADIDDIAKRALKAVPRSGRQDARSFILDLATDIATCAVRHRGALLLTMYESPPGAWDDLVPSATGSPATIEAAMLAALQMGQRTAYIRPHIDLPMLAQRLCQSMLQVGVGVFHGSPGGEQTPAIKCRMLLDGLAAFFPADANLDRSSALGAADRVIATWHDLGGEADERAMMLRAVARAEFGRRGYEATTIRDIAGAAGVSTASVYRLIGSKDELLESVMRSFAASVNGGWKAVLESDSTAIEKLDGLMWVNINLLDRFADEFRIQLAWLRQSPPNTADAGASLSISSRLRHLRALVGRGIREGELQPPGGSADLRAQCLLELIWTSEQLVRAGSRTALAFGRDTLLRGAASRR